MYYRTSKIIIPTNIWSTCTKKINRTRLKTLLDMASKANQLDNWNTGNTYEGDTVFAPRTEYERELWNAIRAENRKLFQRSNAGKNGNGGHLKK
jgi:hypothetical protein